MNKYKDIEIGDVYGRLTILELDSDKTNNNRRKRKYYKCSCICGNEKSICGESLKDGTTLSCGCYQKERTSKSNRKFNTYDLTGDYGIGYTDKNEEFYFDLEDYDKIKDYYWYLDVNGYPSTVTITKNDKHTSIKMHNLIFHTKDGFIPDHRDRCRQNNRKYNLYEVTKVENNINKNMRNDNTQGYIGIGYDKRRDKYFGYIDLNKKRKYLGYCLSKEDAIRKRLFAELEIFGKDLAPQRHLFEEWNITC